MPFYYTTETLRHSGTKRTLAFKKINTSKRILFINKFEFLPDIYMAKNGSIEVFKNGKKEFDSTINNEIRKYSQFGITEKILFLDQLDDIEVYINSKTNIDVKINMTLSLDFQSIPESSIYIKWALLELASLSESISILEREILDSTPTAQENVYPFDVIGYSKMIFTIEAISAQHPVLIYNDSQGLPADIRDDIIGMYWGNKAALTLSEAGGPFQTAPISQFVGNRTFNAIKNWNYASNFPNFRNRLNQVIDPRNINGTGVTVEALYSTNNFFHNEKTFLMNLESPNNFSFEKIFQYTRSINYYLRLEDHISWRQGQFPNFKVSTAERLIFTLKGKRVFLTATYQLVVEGSNNRNFSGDVQSITTIENYNGLPITLSITTDREYVRIQKKMAYTVMVADSNESVTVETTFKIANVIRLDTGLGNSASDQALQFIGDSLIFNALPTQGQAYLPNRVAGWNEINLSENIPERLHTWLYTSEPTESANPEPFEINSFDNDSDDETTITIALEAKGVNGEWFTLLESIGEIANVGKTLITLSEFDFNKPLVIAKGQKLTRFKVTTSAPIELSIGAVLTN